MVYKDGIFELMTLVVDTKAAEMELGNVGCHWVILIIDADVICSAYELYDLQQERIKDEEFILIDATGQEITVRGELSHFKQLWQSHKRRKKVSHLGLS